MKRAVARWTRTVAGRVPTRVGTTLLLGAWLVLTLLFTFVGNVVVLTAVTAMSQPLPTASLLATVVGVFGTPAISLVLARRVVAEAIARFEFFVRQPEGTSDGGRLVSCERNERGRCRTTPCC